MHSRVLTLVSIIFIVITLVPPPVAYVYMVEDFESASGIWGGYFGGYWAGGQGRLTTDLKLPGWEGTSGWSGTTQPYNWGFHGMYYNTWNTPYWPQVTPHSESYAGGLANPGLPNLHQFMSKEFTVPLGGFPITYYRRYKLDSSAQVFIRLYDTQSPFIITLESISPATGEAFSDWTERSFNIPSFFYRSTQLRFRCDWIQGSNIHGFSYILFDDIAVIPELPPAILFGIGSLLLFLIHKRTIFDGLMV